MSRVRKIFRDKYNTPSPKKPLRIGTRGSLLAVAQAEEVRNRLSSEFELPFTAFEIVKITTSGDLITDRPLKEIAGRDYLPKKLNVNFFWEPLI